MCLGTLAGGQQVSAQEIVASTPSADEVQFQQGVAAYDDGRFTDAYEIWLPLAQNGNLTAQRNVGHMLRRGLGVTQNYNRALRFYKKAARAGLVGAQVNLASMYGEGLGTKQSFKQAAYWYAKAAKAGHPHGQYELAKLAEAGLGTRQNIELAKQLYTWASEAGHSQASERLAALNTRAEATMLPDQDAAIGHVVLPLQARSQSFKTIAGPGEAATEHALFDATPAQIALFEEARQAYLSGNRGSAVESWSALASAGVSEAQFRLGLIYLLGTGSEQDLVQAYTWFANALSQGHLPAGDMIAQLLKVMPPEGLEQAQELAKNRQTAGRTPLDQ